MTDIDNMNNWNAQIIAEFRANGGEVASLGVIPIVILHSKGAKSGLERENPLVPLIDGDALYLFASKADGGVHNTSSSRLENPMQYRNLGRTGIKVSPYALGALMFATQVGNTDPEDSIRGGRGARRRVAGARRHRGRGSERAGVTVTAAPDDLAIEAEMTGGGGYSVEPWHVTEHGLDLAMLVASESIFALSNGHIGLRGNLDEGDPYGMPGTYLNSVFELRPLPYAEAGYGNPESGQTSSPSTPPRPSPPAPPATTLTRSRLCGPTCGHPAWCCAAPPATPSKSASCAPLNEHGST